LAAACCTCFWQSDEIFHHDRFSRVCGLLGLLLSVIPTLSDLLSVISAGGIRPKILIVDDDPDIRDVLRENLSSNKFDVSVAEDGIAGWEKILDVHPHIVVSDLAMPRLSGRFLCKRIKADPAVRNTWVIIFSGWPSDSTENVFSDCPADAYVEKPRIGDLVEAIWNALEELLMAAGKDHRPKDRLDCCTT
jgi:CheY-like chemotaxis protein